MQGTSLASLAIYCALITLFCRWMLLPILGAIGLATILGYPVQFVANLANGFGFILACIALFTEKGGQRFVAIILNVPLFLSIFLKIALMINAL